jgi:hypothetical protein
MINTSGKYKIQSLKGAEYALWDKFISAHPYATLFHTTTWAHIIESVFNRKFEIQVIYKNNIIIGGLLYFPKSMFGIHAIPRVPITAYQGLLIQPPESQKSSSASAEEHQLTGLILDDICQRYSYIDLTLGSEITDMRPYKWHHFTAEPIYTYTFKISEYDELSKQFSQSLRRKINVSSKDDHSVITSTDTEKLVKFVTDSYRHHKLKPPVPSEKIDQLVQLCLEKELGRLYYLMVDEKPAAALFVLYDQNHVYALFSGIDLNYRNEQYTEYLHVAVLQDPDFQGKLFDFLGANTPDFEQFKRSFGGDLRQSFRVVYYKNVLTRILLKIREQQHLLSRRLPGSRK